MASKITQMVEATAPSSGDDVIELVIDTATTPANRRMKLLNLLKRIFLSDATQLTWGAVTDGQFVKRSGTTLIGASAGGGGLGDVVGPASATDNAVARYDSTTGKLIQDSNLTVPDDAASTEVGYLNIPQNSQSAAYTTVMADRGKHLLHPAADNNARTFTIDSNANVPYPIGTTITFVNKINVLTIAITADTLTWAEDGSTGSRTLAANGVATALKTTSTEWIISGTGLT